MLTLRFARAATSYRCVNDTPETISRERRDACVAEAAALRDRELLLSRGRLAAVIAGFATFWIAYDTGWFPAPSAVLFIAVFGGLVVAHDRTIRRRKRAERAASYHEASVARFENRWPGTGADGARYRVGDHPYGEDLDIFGHGSVFELISRARTRAGEQRLADWLLTPAPAASVRERQVAVRELARRLDLREEMAVIGEDLGIGLEPDALVRWAQTPITLGSLAMRITALALVAASLATGALWAIGATSPVPFLLALLLEGVFAMTVRERVHRVLADVQRPTRDLRLLAEALARLESEAFESPSLRRLRAALDADGEPPSVRIDRLRRRVDLLDARKNELFAPIAAALLWGTHCAFAIEAWRQADGASVPQWVDTIAEMEALLSLGAYAYEHTDHVFPDVDAAPPTFAAEALGHPLLPHDGCVANDVRLDASRRVLLISGSNMSGKSTLLRAVGLAAVLAQAGAPVRCARLRLSPLSVGASLRIVDSLQTGTSHFYAEVKRLRSIVDLTAGDVPLLFLLDEILHGTNSHDRRIGAEAVVRELVRRGAIGLVTTHDLALAAIGDDPELQGENVHFEDQLVDGVMSFDYRMRPGVVQRSNALELMRSVGLEV